MAMIPILLVLASAIAAPLTGVVQVSSAATTSCARTADGRVACWGNNSSGQLGVGLIGAQWKHDLSRTARFVPGLDDVVDVDTNGNATCAVRRSGEVWCWGSSSLALVTPEPSTQTCWLYGCEPQPVQILGIDQAVAVAVGTSDACVARADGSVWCWGSSMAIGSPVDCGGKRSCDQVPPRPVPGPSGVRILDGGMYAVCAIDGESRSWCWGSNNWGQLAPNDERAAIWPTVVAEGRQDVSVGDAVSCSVGEGAVTCAGMGELGLTGATRGKRVHSLVALPELVSSVEVQSQVCALTAAGTLYCWGDNDDRQLGPGRRGPFCGDHLRCDPQPRKVPIGPVADVGLGEATCAAMRDGTVVCMGSDDNGALGRGSVGERTCNRPPWHSVFTPQLDWGVANPCSGVPAPVVLGE